MITWALGEDPERSIYIQNEMRQHLLKCLFEKGPEPPKLSMFPRECTDEAPTITVAPEPREPAEAKGTCNGVEAEVLAELGLSTEYELMEMSESDPEWDCHTRYQWVCARALMLEPEMVTEPSDDLEARFHGHELSLVREMHATHNTLRIEKSSVEELRHPTIWGW